MVQVAPAGHIPLGAPSQLKGSLIWSSSSWKLLWTSSCFLPLILGQHLHFMRWLAKHSFRGMLSSILSAPERQNNRKWILVGFWTSIGEATLHEIWGAMWGVALWSYITDFNIRDGKSVLDHAAAVLQTKPIHAVVDPDHSYSSTSHSPSRGVCECYQRLSYERNRMSYLGLLAIAILLVVVAALTAGLTLGLSSLDMTWLNIMSTTGSEKRRFVFLHILSVNLS